MPDPREVEADALPEPYRIKVVEHIRLLPREEREKALREAFYSVTYLNSGDVFIDLATDSGTTAMSDRQWGAMMIADEAYVRSQSFFRFEKAVQDIVGYPHVVPTHQGRAAENILSELLVKPGNVVLSNTHFDTARAHVEHKQGIALDLVGNSLWDFDDQHPFKGNFDLEKLALALEHFGARVPFVSITITNNMACSSPVSMDNIRQAKRLADRHNVPILFDASRFAENAYFIKQREPGYAKHSIADIVREMFSYGQGCWMSAKKDANVNIGGFIALRDEALARRCQERLVLYEGFPTYGGLARRDLEAIAVGLGEGIDEAHLRHRTGQVAELGRMFEQAGIRCSKPFGGSGVFVDVQHMYPHLPPERFPERRARVRRVSRRRSEGGGVSVRVEDARCDRHHRDEGISLRALRHPASRVHEEPPRLRRARGRTSSGGRPTQRRLPLHPRTRSARPFLRQVRAPRPERRRRMRAASRGDGDPERPATGQRRDAL